MKKILAIGNSFSDDATAYLHDIAAADNMEIKVANLFIGGCTLKRHWDNIENEAQDYGYYINAKRCERKYSSTEVLKSDNWDIVTVQQASHESGNSESYHPYIENIVAYVHKVCPKAEIFVHETWAYEIDCTNGAFAKFGNDTNKMHECLKQAYYEAAEGINAKIIPCGDIVCELRKNALFDYKNGAPSLCRDGFHLNLYYGRFMAAAAWYETLCGGNILNNSFLPPDNYAEDDGKRADRIALIKNTVHEMCGRK